MKYKKINCIILTSCLLLSSNFSNYTVLANENNSYNNLAKLQDENENYIFLSDLEYDQSMSNTSWSTIKFDKNIDGGKITLNVDNEPLEFDKGIGAHANSNVVFDVSKYSEIYTRFTTYVGIDRSQCDKGNGIKVIVSASNDGRTWTELAKTDVLKGNKNAAFIDVDIKDFRYLKLTANDNGSNGNDHAVYGSPRIMKAGYDINSEYLAGVKKVEYYDQLIKSEYNINSPITEEYERLLLQRTFVKRVGFNTIQSVAKLGSKYANVINWLVNNDNALKLYVTGGEIEGGGSYATSMKALADIYEKHNSDFSDTTNGELYLKMAIATSISHAKTIRLWTGNATPSDPCTRYEIYKNLYTSGLMAEGGNTELFKNLPVELMRWVMDNKIDDEEINWLVNHSLANKASGGNYLDAYTYITYKSGFDYNKDKYYEASKYNEWNKKYNISSLSDYGKKGVHKLWMVFEEGSVCGGLAKTYANLSQVFGIPAAVVGQPGHAATLSYSQNSEGKGIWNIKNDISGWVQSEKGERLPLGWGSKDWDSYYSVSYILLAQKALDDYNNLIKAEYYNYLADVYKNDEEKQIEIYNKALEVQNYNLDSLVGLINAYKQARNKTSDDYLNLAQRVADGLTFFPLPFIDVMKLIEPNITNDSDKVIFDMLKTKTLKRATIATENDVVQPNACKTMANHLLGQNTIELATFSFDGENAGKIIINEKYSDSVIRIRYSLDGGQTFKETNNKIISLSKEELESITSENDIIIGLVGTSTTHTIDIKDGESISTKYLTKNDLENILVGKTSNLEFSIDDGNTWFEYRDDITFPGYQIVKVRYKAHDNYLEGEINQFTFIEDIDTDSRKYIPSKNISLAGFSTQQSDFSNHAAVGMIDANPFTTWHTKYNYNDPDKFLTIELNNEKYITEVEYEPAGQNGRIKSAEIYTSLDNNHWELAGSINNLANNTTTKSISLNKPTKAKYIKIIATETYGNSQGEHNMYVSGKGFNFFEDTTIKEIKESVDTYNVYFSEKDSSLYINASFEGIDDEANKEFKKVAKLVNSQGQEVEGAVITTQNFKNDSTHRKFQLRLTKEVQDKLKNGTYNIEVSAEINGKQYKALLSSTKEYNVGRDTILVKASPNGLLTIEKSETQKAEANISITSAYFNTKSNNFVLDGTFEGNDIVSEKQFAKTATIIDENGAPVKGIEPIRAGNIADNGKYAKFQLIVSRDTLNKLTNGTYKIKISGVVNSITCEGFAKTSKDLNVINTTACDGKILKALGAPNGEITLVKEDLSVKEANIDITNAYFNSKSNNFVLDGTFEVGDTKASKQFTKIATIVNADGTPVEDVDTIKARNISDQGKFAKFQLIVSTDVMNKLQDGTYKIKMSGTIDSIPFEGFSKTKKTINIHNTNAVHGKDMKVCTLKDGTIQLIKENVKEIIGISDVTVVQSKKNGYVIKGIFGAKDTVATSQFIKTAAIVDSEGNPVDCIDPIKANNLKDATFSSFQFLVPNDVLNKLQDGTYKIKMSGTIDGYNIETILKSTNEINVVNKELENVNFVIQAEQNQELNLTKSSK
ncbi:NPCBM/NEW2 domain-containing protein [Clostridium perfringens]|uniref:NPCBM/NEW2 domain-containing protein n=1 Tax=Clostridium perfringens TaxID=1502 RepID=UPI003CF87741